MIKFATCDVQSSIYNINVNNNNNLKNINVKEIITEFKFDLLLFSYVLVENAISVKQNNFIFVKETLSLATPDLQNALLEVRLAIIELVRCHAAPKLKRAPRPLLEAFTAR